MKISTYFCRNYSRKYGNSVIFLFKYQKRGVGIQTDVVTKTISNHLEPYLSKKGKNFKLAIELMKLFDKVCLFCFQSLFGVSS